MLKAVAPFISANGGIIPNRYNDVYKNRRGRLTAVRVWIYQDLGTGRSQTLFVTYPNNTLVNDITILRAKVGEYEWPIGDKC